MTSMLFICILAIGCEPEWHDGSEYFRIPEGKHGTSTIPKMQALQADFLQFEATFDSSAIYQTSLAENQHDINKLIGFADCNAHHHENSARFGWRWLEGQLEIFAYCYVEGERISQRLGTAQINETQRYTIGLDDDHYLFQIENQEFAKIRREKPCSLGMYYMLFPYFGGDETAPHDIAIKVKFLY